MKKVIMFLMTVMMMVCLTACSGSENVKEPSSTETVGEDALEDDTTAVDILNDVWTTYGDEEKFFAMGGDMNNPVDNAAGDFGLEDVEALGATLYVPADAVEMIDEAASLMHAMNANTFTGASYHLKDVKDADAFVTALKENILNTQWMCGFPDELVIYSVKDAYVVSAFGNAEIMEVFKGKIATVYGEDAKLLVEEDIAQ